MPDRFYIHAQIIAFVGVKILHGDEIFRLEKKIITFQSVLSKKYISTS